MNMRSAMQGVLTLGLVMLAAPAPMLAQGTAIVEGRVLDEMRRPLIDAVVLLQGTLMSARTDMQGNYSIKGIPAGTVTLRAQAPNRKPFELSGLRLIEGQTVTQNFMLEGMPPRQRPMEGGILLRFQLIRPIAARTTDKSIVGIDSVLRELFQWNGYQLLSQAAVTSDLPGPGSVQTSQQLQVDGEPYTLVVSIDSVTPQKVRMRVSLTGIVRRATPSSAGGKTVQSASLAVLLSTTVTVSFGHTAVIGTTQTGTMAAGGAGNGTLILVVKPEMRTQ
jgi:hypothetical protein